MAVGFTRRDANRVAAVVRRVENAPLRGVPNEEPRRWRGGGGAAQVFYIEITGRRTGYESGVDDAREYKCNVWRDPLCTLYDEFAINQNAFCVQHAQTETVPNDSKFLAFKQTIDDETVYVFEVPRDL